MLPLNKEQTQALVDSFIRTRTRGKYSRPNPMPPEENFFRLDSNQWLVDETKDMTIEVEE